mmetsp:Transcript_25635/g.78870  ORF Transcript_25635/g.78870 Transcript_25635/m.78870 type:complete len:119 (+) Transcript_25635:548-904(+)
MNCNPRSCACWISTVQEVYPDPLSEVLNEAASRERTWPCPARGKGHLHYFDASVDDNERSFELDMMAVDCALDCNRCFFSVGRRRLCQCTKCDIWVVPRELRKCEKRPVARSALNGDS